MEAVVRKAKIAVEQGAAVVHNGSAGGDVREIQQRLQHAVDVPWRLPSMASWPTPASPATFVDLPDGDFIEAARRDIDRASRWFLCRWASPGDRRGTEGQRPRDALLSKSGSIIAHGSRTPAGRTPTAATSTTSSR